MTDFMRFVIQFDNIRQQAFNWSPDQNEKINAVTFRNEGATTVKINNTITLYQSQEFTIPGNLGEALSKNMRLVFAFANETDMNVSVTKKIYVNE